MQTTPDHRERAWRSMMTSSARRLPWMVLVASIACMPLMARAQQVTAKREVIAGVVTDSTGRGITGAEVMITPARTFETQRITTDNAGRFVLVIQAGTGDYLITITSPGHVSHRLRTTFAADVDSVAVPIMLAAGRAVLETVRVHAERPVARDPNSSLGARGAATENVISQQIGGLSAYDGGNIEATAALNPTLTAGANGIGALGLGSEQSRTTINGLSFEGTAIPRDMRRTVRSGTSQYDPAVGGFSAALTTVEIRQGSSLTDPNLRVSLDGPLEAVRYRSTAGVGHDQRFALSFTQSGQMTSDRWTYNGAMAVRGTNALVPTIGSLTLAESGVPSSVSSSRTDDVLAVRQAAGSHGVPWDARSRVGAGEMRFDMLARVDRLDDARTGSVAWLSGLSWERRTGQGLDALAVPTAAATNARADGFLQVSSSRQTRDGAFVEWRTGITATDRSRHATVAGPTVRVLLQDTDSISSYANLRLGGGEPVSSDRRLSWEGAFSRDRRYQTATTGSHQVRYVAQAQVEHQVMTTGDDFGSFFFSGVDQLATGYPSRFTRRLDPIHRSGNVMNAAIGLGDTWRPNRFLAIQLALRMDMGGLLRGNAPDDAVAESLGIRSASTSAMFVPALSPRVGFTWNYAKEKSDAPSSMNTRSGSMAFPGDGQVRGGIGMYRSFWRVSDAIASGNGAGQIARSVSCWDGNSPSLAWWSVGPDAPDACVDGTGVIESRASTYLLEGFAPPSAWRGSLIWARKVARMHFEIGGTISVGVNQRLVSDENRVLTEQFHLTDEGGRPSYRAASDISVTTGAATQAAILRNPGLGEVLAVSAMGRNLARQLSASVTPLGLGKWILRASSAYTESRTLQNGWDVAGALHPTDRYWASTVDMPRWRSVVEFGRNGSRLSLSGIARFDAGERYSPVVLGDVNGDGRGSNDLAFIPKFQNSPTDTSRLSAALAELAAGSSRVRQCLTRQQGTIAQAGSCVAPPNLAIDVALAWFPTTPALVRRGGGRGTYTLRIENVAAFADAMLHATPHGWGAARGVDPFLYAVQGFDPSTRRFRYAPNAHFGAARENTSGVRAPYRISVDARFFLGRSIADQEAARTFRRSRIGGVQRLSAEQIAGRLARTFREPFTLVLEQGDSLLLQREQIEAIGRARQQMTTKTDSIWLATARYFSELPEKFDVSASGDRLQKTYTDVIKALQDGVQVLHTILLPPQISRLPGDVSVLLRRGQPLYILQ